MEAEELKEYCTSVQNPECTRVMLMEENQSNRGGAGAEMEEEHRKGREAAYS